MAPRNNAAAQAAAQREREQRERERQQREREAQRQREQAQREREQREREAQRQREQAQRERERAQREAQQAREREQAQRERERQQAQAQREREQQQAREREQAQAQAQQQQISKNNSLTQNLRIAAENGVTRNELQSIAQKSGVDYEKVVKRADAMNANGQDIRLNAGAANTIFKELSNQNQYELFNSTQSMGTGNIARAIQGMVGTPGYTAPRNPQSGGAYGGSREAVPGTGLMIGGTQIRPGGQTAVIRPVGAAPAVAPAAPATMTPETIAEPASAFGGTDMGTGGFEDFGFDMSSLADLMASMPPLETFEPISSQVDTMDPIQLAQLGRAYGADAIRARQRSGRARSAYRRGPTGMMGIMSSPMQQLANLSIGGGLTL